MQTTKPDEERRARREPTQQTPPRKPTRKPDDDGEARYEDPVDEASAEAMIASDPPASSGFRVGPAKRRRSG